MFECFRSRVGWLGLFLLGLWSAAFIIDAFEKTLQARGTYTPTMTPAYRTTPPRTPTAPPTHTDRWCVHAEAAFLPHTLASHPRLTPSRPTGPAHLPGTASPVPLVYPTTLRPTASWLTSCHSSSGRAATPDRRRLHAGLPCSPTRTRTPTPTQSPVLTSTTEPNHAPYATTIRQHLFRRPS